MSERTYLYEKIDNINSNDNLALQLIYSFHLNTSPKSEETSKKPKYIHKYSTNYYRNKKLYK